MPSRKVRGLSLTAPNSPLSYRWPRIGEQIPIGFRTAIRCATRLALLSIACTLHTLGSYRERYRTLFHVGYYDQKWRDKWTAQSHPAIGDLERKQDSTVETERSIPRRQDTMSRSREEVIARSAKKLLRKLYAQRGAKTSVWFDLVGHQYHSKSIRCIPSP